MQVLLLAVWNSRKEVMLLITTIGISCLILGPLVFYLDLAGALLSSTAFINLPNVPTSE